MGFTNGEPSFNPVPKGLSRSQVKAQDDQADVTAEEKWKRKVRKLDDNHCRWCKRRVKVTIELLPERAECHHVAGRFPVAIRWDVRNGILLCNTCHERVTGKVNEKHIIVCLTFYEIEDEGVFPNGRGAVEFKRIA